MLTISINDGICKSMSSSSAEGLKENVAQYYSLSPDDLEYRESDDGDMLAYVGGENIGFVRRVK